MEAGHGIASFGQGAEAVMQIGRVVERVTLDKHGNIRECPVSLGEVMKIGVRFAPDVGERFGMRDFVAFVVDRDSEIARHATEPCDVLVVPGDDKLKRRLHGGNLGKLAQR